MPSSRASQPLSASVDAFIAVASVTFHSAHFRPPANTSEA
jgi:hypothetical protein